MTATRHLLPVPDTDWPEDGLETVERCPVCASPGRKRLHDGLRDTVFFCAPGLWTLWRCASCRSAYLGFPLARERAGGAEPGNPIELHPAVMRVLALTRYGRLGASSRLRTYQFQPHLEARGIHLKIAPFFDDRYVQAIYGARGTKRVARSFARRAMALLRRMDADALWLEKEAFPWLPWMIEAACLPRSLPLVVDCDDAIFHRYDMHPSAAVRAVLGRKIDAVMRRADLVLAGNAYLAARARSAGASRIEVVPTVVDLDRYRASHPNGLAEPVVIGWIGSPKTASYLEPVKRLLRRVAEQHPLSCLAIGARPDQVSGGPFVAKPWSEADEAESLSGLHIGIMPLPDEPWTRGKCGYKLIQYMACGLPVVASPVGVNCSIVRHGENGFLASTEREWEEAVTRLILDPDQRRRMGSAGRRRVEAEFSLQVQAPRIERLLRSVAALGCTAMGRQRIAC